MKTMVASQKLTLGEWEPIGGLNTTFSLVTRPQTSYFKFASSSMSSGHNNAHLEKLR